VSADAIESLSNCRIIKKSYGRYNFSASI